MTGSEETIEALRHIKLSFIFIAVLLVGVDFISGAGRIYIFLRKLDPPSEKHAFWAAFRGNLSNIFLAAATPFQTGGGIAQIYMIQRAGYPVSGVTSISIMNFTATLAMLMIAGLLAIRWMANQFADFQFKFILSFSSIVFYIVLALFFIFLFRPTIISTFIQWILTGLSRRWKKKAQMLLNANEKLHEFIENYQQHIRYFFSKEKMILFHNLWLTIVLYFNKCLTAYVILKGMGLDPSFWHVVSLQILIIFIIYFCPTPGASFLAETSTAALMSLVIDKPLIPVFILLWRFFTTYFGVIVGGFILMRAIGRSAPGSSQSTETGMVQ